jgi:hypothetical protein
MELLRLLLLSVLILSIALWLQSLLDESQALDTDELPQEALEPALVGVRPAVWLPLTPLAPLPRTSETEPSLLRLRPRPIPD